MGTAATADSGTKHGSCTTRQFREVARQVYQPWSEPVKGQWRLKKLKACATAKRRVLMSRIERNLLKGRREVIRAYRSYTPYSCGAYGRFATPCYIVERESRYDPHAENPSSTAGGYYQILDSTWYSSGGRPNGYSHPAAHAPVLEQHRVAHRLVESQGLAPWACC